MTAGVPDAESIARALIAEMSRAGATLASAESVTGGRLVALLTSIPGSSAVVRGAVVAYCSPVKADVLGVDPDVLAERGPVCDEVAEQMARGARRQLGSTYAVATTGEAGPESASGRPVGTVHVAVSGPGATVARALPTIAGQRDQIQQAAVAGALQLLAEVWAARGDGGTGSEPAHADRGNIHGS